ncbi:hypothetical protein JOM56_013132 [Amanita muscaria]
MASQTPNPGARMFDNAGGEFLNANRDVYKIVINSNHDQVENAGANGFSSEDGSPLNANAAIEGGEFYNVGCDVYKIVINESNHDTFETIQAAVPISLEEIRKIRFSSTADGNTGNLGFPSEDGSPLEGEPSHSPLLETESIADIYTRSMLKCLTGYPLYDPQPYSDLSEEYMRKGVRVGDVGIITKDGAFDFLFNVCPSQNSLINPPNLPRGFTLETSEDSKTYPKEQFPHDTHLFESPVSRTKTLFKGPIYTSSEARGAILELPEGAFMYSVASKLPFRRLASRYGEQWYKYAIGTRGEDVLNGSLRVVTSCTKCTQWGIAVFDRPCTPQDSLRFVQNKGLFRDSGLKYSWKGSSTFTTKVAPSPGSNEGDSLNQCVFFQGYKVKVREDIFNNLCNDLPHQPPRASTSSPPALLHRRVRYRDPEQPNFDPSPMEAKNEDDHGIPIQIETPFVAPEHPFIDRGSGDVQSSREAEDGEDTDLSIPKEAPPITTKLHSVDRGDGVVQGGEPTSMSFLQGSSSVEILNSSFSEVHGNATTKLTHSLDAFTDLQRNLICDYIANPTVLPDINGNVKEHVLTQSTMILPRAKAVFNDYQTKKNSGPCFGGTRVALLREMAHWVTSPDGSRMYVLSGLAGTGKSTVAYTIASRAADLDLLGASFFFTRDDSDCNSAKKFFPTIAYQLCVYNDTFAKAIGDVLDTERGSAAITKGPREQLQVLILEPLRSIVRSRVRPILVVVDALDECDEDDERAVVKGLRQLIRELPSFKVILTTRPQPESLDPFFGNQGGHEIFHLQDIGNLVVDGDIRLYLKHYLSPLQVQKHYPERQWCASDEEIESLVRASRRLFVIASRAVQYILDKSTSNPAAQMQDLLHAFAQGRMPFDLNEIQQDFDMNFGRVFGWGAIVGILMAILAHQR